MNVIARYHASSTLRPNPKRSRAYTAGTRASTIIAYGLSQRSVRLSVRLFCVCACSIRPTSRARVLSPAGRTTSASTLPFRFTVPDASSAPGALSTGTLSPVMGLSSTLV